MPKGIMCFTEDVTVSCDKCGFMRTFRSYKQAKKILDLHSKVNHPDMLQTVTEHTTTAQQIIVGRTALNYGQEIVIDNFSVNN